MSRGLFTVCCMIACAVANVCAHGKVRRLQYDGLSNVWQLHAKVISGGTPDADAGFARLKQIGVKTIISVDSARPDLETAQKYGLRYVHLALGYEGISKSHAKTLAKAVAELPGPIYIHCHHGKHRSPAAAAVACIGAGLVDTDQGVMFLRTAGTSERYAGLYAAVKEAQRFEKDALDSLDISFTAVTDVPPLAKAMVKIETTFENLMVARRSNWQVSAKHPDIDAAHEALLLKEHFAELLRTPSSDQPSQAFHEILRDSHTVASRIEALLNRRPLSAETVAALSSAITDLKTDCRRCHVSHRDLASSRLPQNRRSFSD